MRDVTDINHPTTLATFDSPSAPYGVFVGAGAVATIVPAGQNTQRIMLIRYSGQPEPLVESYGYALTGLNWSPDGSKLTFMVDPSSSIPWEWHVVSSGIDRIVGYTPGVCACGEGIQDRTGVWFDYSPDGRYMSFVQDAPGGIDLQIRKPDGTLVTDINPGSARSGDYVSQPVWSGGRLYFRDSKGVEVWDSGTVKPFLPGVAWAAPHSSPAGGVITYSAPDATGQPHVFTVETTTGLVRQIAAKVTHDPHFLTDRYIWYRGAQRCPAGYYCAGLSKGPDAGYLDTGVDYIFDLQTGAEYTSRITAVGDIWPRGQ